GRQKARPDPHIPTESPVAIGPKVGRKPVLRPLNLKDTGLPSHHSTGASRRSRAQQGRGCKALWICAFPDRLAECIRHCIHDATIARLGGNTKPDTNAYLESWGAELLARSNRVRQLIGDAHWLSDGHHKEAIVREFLRRHLPSGLIVSRGFVRSPGREANCSPELDVLVADPSAHPPLFSEGDLHIVAPTSVMAHLAIKTTFAKKELLSALIGVGNTQLVTANYANPDRIWRSILFFETPDSRTTSSVLETIKDSFLEATEILRDKIAAKSATKIQCFPTCISTLSQWIVFISPESSSTIKIKMFELKDLSFAYAFADLFSFVRRWHGQSVLGELDEMLETIGAVAPQMLHMDI
ncbi:MAG: DUF6602 domain-containing protein, partial [Betaproteobacteria bacterium]